MDKIRLTKLDAALRQLNAAIRLFFEGGDEVAIHTLAGAVSQVTADLIKAKGGTSLLRSLTFVKDEHRKMVHRKIAEAENFFKHADHDPDATIEFNPKTTDFFIMAAIAELELLGAGSSREMKLFKMWFLLTNEGMLLEGEATKPIRALLDAVRAGGAVSKQDFLDLLNGTTPF